MRATNNKPLANRGALTSWDILLPTLDCRLGGSGGVVNSLDFCQASLKSLGCFYFRCVLSSLTMEVGDGEFANFTLPTLKAVLEARSQNVSGNLLLEL